MINRDMKEPKTQIRAVQNVYHICTWYEIKVEKYLCLTA